VKDEHVIEATGVAWEYFVSSASNPQGQFHIVSLSENFPAGTCTCPQWTCRINPHNRKTGEGHGELAVDGFRFADAAQKLYAIGRQFAFRVGLSHDTHQSTAVGGEF